MSYAVVKSRIMNATGSESVGQVIAKSIKQEGPLFIFKGLVVRSHRHLDLNLTLASYSLQMGSGLGALTTDNDAHLPIARAGQKTLSLSLWLICCYMPCQTNLLNLALSLHPPTAQEDR